MLGSESGKLRGPRRSCGGGLLRSASQKPRGPHRSGGSAAIMEGQHATLGAEGCEEIGGGKLGYERD